MFGSVGSPVAGEDVVDGWAGSSVNAIAHVAPHCNKGGKAWIFSEGRIFKQSFLFKEVLGELTIVTCTDERQWVGASGEVVGGLILGVLAVDIIG